MSKNGIFYTKKGCKSIHIFFLKNQNSKKADFLFPEFLWCQSAPVSNFSKTTKAHSREQPPGGPSIHRKR